jgi:hypothetical protein
MGRRIPLPLAQNRELPLDAGAGQGAISELMKLDSRHDNPSSRSQSRADVEYERTRQTMIEYRAWLKARVAENPPQLYWVWARRAAGLPVER